MNDLDKINKLVKCKTFKEAFVFDGVLTSTHKLPNKFGCKSITLWIFDHRYGALVNIRLHQMFYWRAAVNRKKNILLFKFYSCLSVFLEWFIYVVYSHSISPMADIGRGFGGSMRNLEIGAGVIIGENSFLHGNVAIVLDGVDVPVLGVNVHIGTNTVVSGKARIGDNTIVGPNCYIYEDISANCTVVGNPACVVFKGKK